MIFYKHFIGDYQRDTGHLSILEHGAYRLLMDAFYATEKPLPSDERRLFRLLSATEPEEHQAVRTVLAEFWQRSDDGWVNARAEREIADWKEFLRLQRERGKRGGRPRKGQEKTRTQPGRNPEQSAGFSPGLPEKNPDVTPTQASHSHSQTQNPKRDSEGARARASPGTRLSPDWTPCEAAIAFAAENGLTDDAIRHTADRFRDYWIAQPGQKGVKRDWLATWRNWVRRDTAGGGAGQPPRNGQGGRRTQREIKTELAGAFARSVGERRQPPPRHDRGQFGGERQLAPPAEADREPVG